MQIQVRDEHIEKGKDLRAMMDYGRNCPVAQAVTAAIKMPVRVDKSRITVLKIVPNRPPEELHYYSTPQTVRSWVDRWDKMNVGDPFTFELANPRNMYGYSLSSG